MRKKRKLDKNIKMQELKRREAINEDYKRALSFIVVLVIIIGLLALLFYVNGKFVTKDMFQGETTTTTTEPKFEEDVILINNIFTIKDSEYMVLIYDSSDDAQDMLYNGANYMYMNNDVKLYTVDLANKMNKKYYDKKGKENTSPTKASEIVITRPTLMVIKKGKVIDYITDSKVILEKLSEDEE